MADLEEINVTISKTIQEKDFEPLRMEVSLKRMVKPNEVSSQIREVSELLESEIVNFMDVE